MAIDYDSLRAYAFPETEQRYGFRDAALYALGIGYGHDPMDRRQLDFVYERNFKVAPTFAVVLATPGMWQRDPATGIDWVKVVHGEQAMVLHRPLPVEATIVGRMRITGIVDKGAGKGALVLTERELFNKASGEKLATLSSISFCRSDGGFGDRGDTAPEPHRLPDGVPEFVCDLPTLSQAALIHRLSGDYNPLHADPDAAAAAGFRQPILHGLATFGIAGHAVIKTYADYRPEALRSLRVRFTAPVYPGETVRTEMWRRGDRISLRSRILERDVVVLNNGSAQLA